MTSCLSEVLSANEKITNTEWSRCYFWFLLWNLWIKYKVELITEMWVRLVYLVFKVFRKVHECWVKIIIYFVRRYYLNVKYLIKRLLRTSLHHLNAWQPIVYALSIEHIYTHSNVTQVSDRLKKYDINRWSLH